MPSVSGSIVINAPPEVTWGIVSDFNGLPGWQEGVAASEIEGGGDPNRIGVVRRLTTADGATIRETLLELSDADRYLRYNAIEAPVPVREYVGTLRVTAEGEGRSRLEMTSSWENDPADEKQLVEMFNELLPQGLASAKKAIER
jgi:Polyketide cyclase / dehydrase and lipid transport